MAGGGDEQIWIGEPMMTRTRQLVLDVDGLVERLLGELDLGEPMPLVEEFLMIRGEPRNAHDDHRGTDLLGRPRALLRRPPAVPR